MTDLEERIGTSLSRLAAEYRDSEADVVAVSRRAIRQTRARAVAAGVTVIVVVAVVSVIVFNQTSDQAPIDDGTTATTLASALDDPLLLWPDAVPEGSVLVDASREVVAADDQASHMGLLVQRDEFGQYVPYWLRVIRDPEVKDHDGTPVELPDGRSAAFLPGTLVVLDPSAWIVIEAAVDEAGLIAAAEVLQLDGAGNVGVVDGAPPEWQLVAPIPQSERAQLRMVFTTSGGPRFVVNVASAMPEIGPSITTQPQRLIREPSANGDIWHLDDISLMHRDERVWIVTGTRVEPGMSVADRSALLRSLRPATASEKAQIESAIQRSAVPPTTCCPPKPSECSETKELNAHGRYVIKGGDYLNLIAACFGVSLDALMEANPSIGVIVPGDEIVIPTG